MLLPALSKAREKARTISCANNEKTLGIYANMYMGEYNDTLLINDYDNKNHFGYSMYLAGIYGKAEAATMLCPMSNIYRKETKDTNDATDDFRRHFERMYGINVNLMCKAGVWTWKVGFNTMHEGGIAFLTMTSCKSPTEFILAGDQFCTGFWLGGTNWQPAMRYYWPGTVNTATDAGSDYGICWHGGAMNALFGDGHVEMVKKNVLVDEHNFIDGGK